MVFALVLSRLRFFYGVMLGTFVLSYMGNSVIELSMEKGNRALRRCAQDFGISFAPFAFSLRVDSPCCTLCRLYIRFSQSALMGVPTYSRVRVILCCPNLL